MTERRDESIAVRAMNEAADVARKIWDDLCDRSGFGLECLESDDEDTFKDTIASHVRIIASTMVPASDLESVTRERDAAVRRVGELELAVDYIGRERDANHAQYWREHGELEGANLRIKYLESLLTPKDPDVTPNT